MASAVVAELARALPGHDIRCADVWLLRPPLGTVMHDSVWSLVAMVAVSAMAYGRATLWYMNFAEASRAVPDGGFQSLITDFYPLVSSAATRAPHASCVDRAARRAAAKFWVLLQDFVQCGIVPSDWDSGVIPFRHPFVGMSPDGGLVLNLPAHYTLPDAVHD